MPKRNLMKLARNMTVGRKKGTIKRKLPLRGARENNLARTTHCI